MGESTQWPGVPKEFKTNEKYENTTLLPPHHAPSDRHPGKLPPPKTSSETPVLSGQASAPLGKLGNVTITVWPQGHFTVRFFFLFTPLATLFPR